MDYGRREVPQKRSRNRKPRRNDGPWREQCLTRRGRYCRACHPVIAAGCVVPGHPIGGSGTAWNPLRLEVDHIKPRGQGGPSVVENGLVLCSEHHQAKTESRLLIRFEWLDPDQVAFLAAVGWCWWDDAGQPNGRGFKHFAANRAA